MNEENVFDGLDWRNLVHAAGMDRSRYIFTSVL